MHAFWMDGSRRGEFRRNCGPYFATWRGLGADVRSLWFDHISSYYINVDSVNLSTPNRYIHRHSRSSSRSMDNNVPVLLQLPGENPSLKLEVRIKLHSTAPQSIYFVINELIIFVRSCLEASPFTDCSFRTMDVWASIDQWYSDRLSSGLC